MATDVVTTQTQGDKNAKLNETKEISAALSRVAPNWLDESLKNNPMQRLEYLMECLTKKADVQQFEQYALIVNIREVIESAGELSDDQVLTLLTKSSLMQIVRKVFLMPG